MLKLIGYELYKILTQRITFIIIIFLFIVNGGVIFYTAQAPLSENVSYTYITVNEVYRDYSGIDAETLASELEDWLARYNDLYWIDDENNFHGPSKTDEEEMLVYTDTLSDEAALYRTVLMQLESLISYEEYLQDIRNNANQLVGASLFSKKGSFSYLNIQKTAAAYADMEKTVLTVADSSGIKLVSESILTTICILFVVIYAALMMVVVEWENNYLALFYPMKKGRTPLIMAKFLAMAFLIFVFLLFFYGENLMICSGMFGLGDMNRSIQSLYGYTASYLHLSVGGYLVAFFVLKYISVLAAGLFFLLICLFAGSYLPACLINACILATELILYTEIPIHSLWSPLRQINLVSLLDTCSYFDDYNTFNFFGWPVNTFTTAFVVAFFVIISCVVLGIFRWKRIRAVPEMRIFKRVSKRKMTMMIPESLFLHELFKLFISRRALLLLGILLVIQIYSYHDPHVYSDKNEYYYRQYSEFLEGELTPEKADYLTQEKVKLGSVSKQIDEIMQKAINGDINREYADYQVRKLLQYNEKEVAFERAYVQYDYLVQQANVGINVNYIYDTGYTALLKDYRAIAMDMGKLCFILVVGLAAFFPSEISSGMIFLIHPSLIGKTGVAVRKCMAAGIFAFFVWLLGNVPRIYSVIQMYHLQHWNNGIRSIMFLSDMPAKWTIFEGFIFFCFLELMVTFIISGTTLIISSKIKKTSPTIIVMLIIIEIPILVYLLYSI